MGLPPVLPTPCSPSEALPTPSNLQGLLLSSRLPANPHKLYLLPQSFGVPPCPPSPLLTLRSSTCSPCPPRPCSPSQAAPAPPKLWGCSLFSQPSAHPQKLYLFPQIFRGSSCPPRPCSPSQAAPAPPKHQGHPLSSQPPAHPHKLYPLPEISRAPPVLLAHAYPPKLYLLS